MSIVEMLARSYSNALPIAFFISGVIAIRSLFVFLPQGINY